MSMVAGLEVARLLHKFCETHSLRSMSNEGHYGQIFSIQQRFAANVRNIIHVSYEMGNTLAQTESDLFVIDTKIIMSNDVIQTIKTAKKIRKEQYINFVNRRMVLMIKSFHWRASETLSGVTNGNRRYIYIHIWYV